MDTKGGWGCRGGAANLVAPSTTVCPMPQVYDRVLLNKEKRRKARLLIYGKGKTADPSERSMNPVSLDGLKQWKEGLDMLRG